MHGFFQGDESDVRFWHIKIFNGNTLVHNFILAPPKITLLYNLPKMTNWPIMFMCLRACDTNECLALCAALGWAQTECHCVWNGDISRHWLLQEQSSQFCAIRGITCCCLLVFHLANSISQRVDFPKFNLLKAIENYRRPLKARGWSCIAFAVYQFMTNAIFSLN